MIEAAIAPNEIRAGYEAELRITLTNTGPGTCTNVLFTLRLPVGLTHLGGKNRIGPVTIAPGETVSEDIQVRAAEPGRYCAASSNFSYRDYRGQSQYPKGFSAGLVAVPAGRQQEATPPDVEPVTARLPLGAWDILRLRVTNPGEADLADVAISFSGQGIEVADGGHRKAGRLAAGSMTEVVFHVRAEDPGEHVPLNIRIGYRGPRGTGTAEKVITIEVHEAEVRNPKRVTVLFLSANPPDTNRLQTDREIREIRQQIRLGAERENIEIETREAIRGLDISQALIEVRPQFVHFAGHGGGGEESLVAEGETGEAVLVPVSGLTDLFTVLGDDVRCVLVNACKTERLARGLKSVLPQARVIGMRRAVGDPAAIRFAAGFYQAIGGGLDIERAFGVGKAQMGMAPDGGADAMPLLL